ncbi:MAG: tetratricopeptide repeat protein [Zoogloeaceae bacterium]|jgi:tetratricopeptide (TPR) repeat protein|nr:tetratricopeptide repeat protein [Zoogloeaceae bacterium]
MFRKFLSALLFAALCGGASVHAADSPAAVEFEAVITEEPARSLDAQDVYQILLGEIALQRGQIGTAALAWQDLARRTGDMRALQRAIEVSAAAQQYDAALELLARWAQLGGNAAEARQFKISLLLAARRIDELEAPILEMLAADPGKLADSFLALSRLFPQFADKKAMYALIARLAERYPDLAEARYTLAIAAIASEQRHIARDALERAQSLRPDWDAPLLALGDLILQEKSASADDLAGLAAPVVTQLQAFLERHPDAREVRLQLARVLIAAQQYPLARKEFDRLLAKNPDNPAILYPVAMLSLQEKDYEAARKHFARLLELPFPDPGAVLFFLARTEEEAGNPKKAMEYYLQVPGGAYYLSARQRASKALATGGDLSAARALLQGSRAQGAPEKTTLLLIEAQLLREAGLHGENLEFLRAALKDQPENLELLYEAAMAAEKEGHLVEMEERLKILIRLQPDNAHAYNALGYSLADRNLRLAEAYDLILKASALAPQDPYIMDSLGWVLYRQGQYQQALTTLEAAYNLKADPEIAAHMGEVLWQLGKQEDARLLWQKAAASAPDNATLKATLEKFQP